MDIKEAIEVMNISYSKAYNAGDAEGVVALFMDNAYLMPPNQAMIQGKKALLEFYQMRVQKNRGNTLTNKMHHFSYDGNLIYQIADYSIVGKGIHEQGKFVNIMQRQPDNTLKYTAAIFNSVIPLPTEAVTRHSGLQKKDLEIFDNMPFIFRVKDVDGRYLWVNRTLAEMAQQEVIGKTDSALGWTDNPEILTAADQKVIESKKPLYLTEKVNFPGRGKLTLSVCKFAGEFEGQKCSFGVSFGVE